MIDTSAAFRAHHFARHEPHNYNLYVEVDIASLAGQAVFAGWKNDGAARSYSDGRLHGFRTRKGNTIGLWKTARNEIERNFNAKNRNSIRIGDSGVIVLCPIGIGAKSSAGKPASQAMQAPQPGPECLAFGPRLAPGTCKPSI